MPETNNANQIIIKKSYFDNIKTSIDSLNSFFSSNFRDKNFPVLDDDFQVDGTIMTILSWLHNVEPAWIDDSSKVESVVATLNEMAEKSDGDLYTQLLDRNDKVALDHINAFVGFKALQFIADNFAAFSDFVNAIYTFELFTNPSKYSDVIDVFSQHIPIDEISDVMGENTYTIFDVTKYVTGVFNNDQITLPKEMNLDTEINRVTNGTDLVGFEILVDESVQEAAEVNYFENTKPEHIKYDEKKGKWMISKQFEKTVNDLVAGLRKCDTTEDLLDYFRDSNKSAVKGIDMILETVVPCIYVRVLNNANKSHDQFNADLMESYTESYNSIVKKNKGALRFNSYDLFSTFKTDKDGTLAFLEDFLKLNLVNDERCVIQNNTLLTLFNIFDSRIYLDILYNVLPDEAKKEYGSEDVFVKEIRSRINKNSRAVNVYKTDSNPSEGNEATTSDKVMEYADYCLTELGDMSITDMQYCEQYHSALMSEIQCLGDAMYNKGTSQIAIDHYIGESYNVFGEGFFSSLFGTKKDKPSGQKHTIAELEKMYGTSFPKDFVDGIESSDYKRMSDIVTGNSVKISIDNKTYDITCLADVNRIYDWNSELAEPVVKYLTFANIGDDDIGIDVKVGTYHIVYSTNEASEPFAKSFKEFMSKLDVSDSVQEGFIGKLIDKHREKKRRQATEQSISVYEERYNVKLSEEYKEILLSGNGPKSEWFGIDGITPDNKVGFDYIDREFDRLKKIKNIDASGLYPVISSSFLDDKYLYTTQLYSDTEGKIYSSLYNKAHKLEVVSDSIKDFMESCDDRRVYFMPVKSLNLLVILKDDVDRFIDLYAKTDSDGTILPAVAFWMYAFTSSGSLGEMLEYDVIPKMKKVLGDDIDFYEECEFTKLVFEPDGRMDIYVKYKGGKETTLESLGVKIQQESYVHIQEQETGDIPDYMRTRINVSDDTGTSPNVTITDINLPPDTPTNPINDLATSIDARMQAGGGLDDMLGAGYNDNPHKNHQDGKIVYNITNNYNNSFNRDSNNTNTTTNTDSSTGKTTTTTTTNTNSNNDKSTGKTVTSNSDSSTRKSVNTDNKGGNNNNNSNHSGDTKDSDTAKRDNSQTFSNGHTVQEVFAFLESEEPLSSGKGAGQPPKGDLLTTAMDADRATLSNQQNAKRRVQKAVNTGKALLKPITRTKQWLTKIVDSLIKRDEDRVKAEIIENPSYRTALYKAMRLAMKFGLTGICFTINGYLGAAYLVVQGAKLADKARLRKEVQEEFAAELEILEDKIRATENDPSPEARKARWQMMRLRSKMKRMIAQSPRSAIKNPRYVI